MAAAAEASAPDADGDMEMDGGFGDDEEFDDGGFGDEDDGFGDDGDGEGWDDEDGDAGDGDAGWGKMSSMIAQPPPTEVISRTRTTVAALKTSDIDLAIQKQVDQLKDSIELDDFQCLLLLRKFKWNVQKVIDNYFTNPEKIRKDAGVCIHPRAVEKKSGMIECQVCMDDVDVKELYSLDCGHQTTCRECWVDYLVDSVRTKECVYLQCPAYKCDVVVRNDVWTAFLAKEKPDAYARYMRFARENFVESSKEFAFCPGNGCKMIYSSAAGIAKEVDCKECKFRFCWACKQESHFPGSCHVATQWNQKNSSESENLQWILAKTKTCPKCKTHIEKNQGCNHMTCRKHAGGCGHEFCWLCKGDWKDHGSATGGYYKCNVYEKNKKEGVLSDEQKASDNAKTELERYEFHWTRFDSHSKSGAHAMKMRETTHERMHELSQKFQWRLSEANFLMEAVQEAILCWSVLAWTYPIAYYYKDKNLDLFKDQQGTLEKFCNGLQAKLDFDLDKLGENKVRQEVIHYTRTSGQYRKNLVEYIETEIVF